MTTRHKTIAEMLKERRLDAGHSKSRTAKEIGVSRQIYPTWETGHAIPGEEWVPPIAIYLDIDEDSLALQRYHEKLERARGVSVSSFSRPIPVAA